jgi:hypothetical protein
MAECFAKTLNWWLESAKDAGYWKEDIKWWEVAADKALGGEKALEEEARAGDNFAWFVSVVLLMEIEEIQVFLELKCLKYLAFSFCFVVVRPSFFRLSFTLREELGLAIIIYFLQELFAFIWALFLLARHHLGLMLKLNWLHLTEGNRYLWMERSCCLRYLFLEHSVCRLH